MQDQIAKFSQYSNWGGEVARFVDIERHANKVATGTFYYVSRKDMIVKVVLVDEVNKNFVQHRLKDGRGLVPIEYDKMFNSGISEMELAKQAMLQIPPLTICPKEEIMKIHESGIVDYALLWCPEINYFTLFQLNQLESMETFNADFSESYPGFIWEAVNNIGTPKFVEFDPDKGAVEIWIECQKDEVEKEHYMFYLLPFSPNVCHICDNENYGLYLDGQTEGKIR